MMPKQYRQGYARFCGRDFIVNSDVLIPRIETEQIVTEVQKFCSPAARYQIADAGTGSGCLGITLAEKFPKATVYLSDISDKALEVARKNATREIIIKSDLLKNYPDILFDIIVANLPYIPTKRISRLPAAVRKYEPHLALDGGPQGTSLINRLLREIAARPQKPALILLEIDDTHHLKNFKIPNSFQAKIKPDQFGRNRFLILQRNYT